MSNEQLFTNEPPKVVKAFTVDQKTVDWMEKNIPERKRSALVNALLNRYIKRQEAKQKAEATVI